MTTTIKTSGLTDAALDLMVAKCEYDRRRHNYGSPCFDPNTKRVYETEGLQQIGVNFAPSTNWAQGGPIIEREKITIWPDEASVEWLAEKTFTLQRDDEYWGGPTPLIAAMRCFVASKLGDEVEIPEELCE